MAGIKGRSGRKGKREEKCKDEIIGLAYGIVRRLLKNKSDKKEEVEKKENTAVEIVKRDIGRDIKMKGKMEIPEVKVVSFKDILPNEKKSKEKPAEDKDKREKGREEENKDEEDA